jgi:tetratricopeptide (TPR) repeat protein
LLAFFTKETAVFVAPAAFVLLIGVLHKSWNSKRQIVQYAIWAGCFVLWFAVRAIATIQTQSLSPGQVVGDFVHRLPLVLQYLGKIFLPVNLNVFPIQEDTVIYFGLIALAILAVVIVLYRQRNLSTLLSGLGIFLLFLLPALIVPNNLNEQTFEHRLYLPMIGMLLLCSQTSLLHNRLSDKNLLYAGVGLCAVLAIVNIKHQKDFSDPLTFWSAAAENSPHSAYANMMLAARLGQDEFDKSSTLFRKAYKLNPKEKYLNFYYGVMLQKKDSVAASEKYLLAEKNSSNYYECDFYLARVAMEKKDLTGAITYLKDYLKNDPGNKIANGNLLLLYMDTNQRDAATAHALHMKQLGMEVPAGILQKLGM